MIARLRRELLILRCWIAYQRALAAVDDADFFRRLANQRANDGLRLFKRWSSLSVDRIVGE